MLAGSLPPTRLEVPHEQGEWIEVRQLGYVELENCRDEATNQFFAKMKQFGPEVVAEFARIQASNPNLIAEAQAAREKADAADEFDRDALLKASVVAWSYTPAYTADLLTQLDERTASWLFRTIVGMYTGEGESDEDRGNVSTPSTVS